LKLRRIDDYYASLSRKKSLQALKFGLLFDFRACKDFFLFNEAFQNY
jgi:hypothetical protein